MSDLLPNPLQALDWLQNGGGFTVQETSAFRDEVQAEREACRYWWEVLSRLNTNLLIEA